MLIKENFEKVDISTYCLNSVSVNLSNIKTMSELTLNMENIKDALWSHNCCTINLHVPSSIIEINVLGNDNTVVTVDRNKSGYNNVHIFSVEKREDLKQYILSSAITYLLAIQDNLVFICDGIAYKHGMLMEKYKL